MIDVFVIEGKLVPRTEGTVIAAKIDMLHRQRLPIRVKRMRMKRLEALLAAYCMVKWGTIPVRNQI